MKNRISIIVYIALILTGIHVVNVVLFAGQLNNFGILPRTPQGLLGIPLSPLLHGGFMHLASNLIGLSIFSFLVMLHGIGYFWRASAFIIVIGGLGVWLVGRGNIHIGASGWVFGLWALCIANAWYNRSFKNILIAILVVVLWGGMVFGVLPTRPHISFEAHLFGALAGIVFAGLHRIKKRRR